ncbi:MAG: phospho-N-acetylmuramoyl-pentapeptide-transferase [Desulfatibacillaceae bacterium]|nr:phospho-N-acetylmuramoyl-pentapeptide-transferase [Desulfatibacillaceae bacterium]
MLYNLLYPLYPYFNALNVFQYLTFRSIYAALTALVLSYFLGPWVISRLRKMQVGQYIRDDGPTSHQKKAGTPTMGGVLIVGSVTAATLLWADITNIFVWLVLFIFWGHAAIGFVDDYLMQVKKRSKGLSARAKFGAQVLVAGAGLAALIVLADFDTRLTIPFFKNLRPDLGWAYLVFGVLVIVGASNAVNLTDGLDGLAIVPVSIAAATYLVFAYVAGNVRMADYLQVPYIPGVGELAVFCGALVGAGMGFLWYNAYPAQVFMGDTGSLPLGAALGSVAVVTKQELALVIVGGLFVVEALSVILQVSFFKLTKGRRIFRMAPIHHHFELKGWPEPKVIVRFWIIAIMLALLSVSTLKLR